MSATLGALPMPRPPAEPTRPLRLPEPSLVTLLQALVGYPSVSLLLTTTPGPRMTPEDAARLAQLARDAQRRLAAEHLPGAGPLVESLNDLVVEAAVGPASAAVAVFASASAAEIVHLPVPVVDRVVVDPSFATRDLVRALHRTPRHVVLVLGPQRARLLEGVGGDLRPARTRSFPRASVTSGAGDPGFLRSVDAALGAWLRLHPAPLLLVGPERMLAAFRAVSRNVDRLAGEVVTSGAAASIAPRVLAERIRPVLDAYLHSRQAEAIALVLRRAAEGRVASGVQDAWLAARTAVPEMLAVEEGFFYPARLADAGDRLVPAQDVDHPEVVDDVVDELIEAVLRRGGWIALTTDGALAAHGRVVLTTRAR